MISISPVDSPCTNMLSEKRNLHKIQQYFDILNLFLNLNCKNIFLTEKLHLLEVYCDRGVYSGISLFLYYKFNTYHRVHFTSFMVARVFSHDG